MTNKNVAVADMAQSTTKVRARAGKYRAGPIAATGWLAAAGHSRWGVA